MIDQCIYEVYKHDKKVFIPDFGAIIYSEYNDSVDFNSLLTFDDGKVLAEVRRQHFLSEEDARKELESYINDVKTALSGGKSVFFGGIGYLSHDKDGNISIEKAKPSYRTSKRKKAATSKVEAVATETSEAPGDEELLQKAYDQESTQNGDQEKMPDIDAEPAIDAFPFAEEDAYPADSDTSDDAWIYDDEPQDTGARGKRRVLKAVLLLLIPLMLLGVAAYYYFDPVEGAEETTELTKHRQVAEVQLVSHADAPVVEEEPAPAAEEAANPVSREESYGNAIRTAEEAVVSSAAGDPAEGDNRHYSLILGSFKIENNADNYQAHLRDQGIEVVKFYGRNDFYFVGYEHIAGKSRAVEMLREVKQQNPDAWIIDRARLSLFFSDPQ